MSDILVAKIGGSTLGRHDTTLEDVVALQRQGLRPVVVHGGGSAISDWLGLHRLPTRFEHGLRVTDAETLRVVVAVLAGLVNKELVAGLQGRGGRAVGLSGADGGLLRARLLDESLGYVGEVTEVDTRPLLDLLDDGFLPVVAPIALCWEGDRPRGQLLNVNADTAAGAIARALAARWLVFLTDVSGVRGRDGAVVSHLSPAEAAALDEAGVIDGGMIPKVGACLRASDVGCRSVVVDGRTEHALLAVVQGQATGTVVG
ncbi:MAG: acetylglutamate kinase [Dehalococcoidia bacterium]